MFNESLFTLYDNDIKFYRSNHGYTKADKVMEDILGETEHRVNPKKFFRKNTK